LQEFLETFETAHNMRNNNAPDHIVTREEFEEYYNNVSASVDTDDYFAVMMTNAWNLDGSRTVAKGWSNSSTAPQKSTLQGSAGNRPQSATQARETASGASSSRVRG
jgi:hypothetical protein